MSEEAWSLWVPDVGGYSETNALAIFQLRAAYTTAKSNSACETSR